METWEVITGILLLLIGLVTLGQSYTTVTQCNSIGGKISTAITSIFGGSGAQACYNAGLSEVGGILIALIGLAIIYLGAVHSESRRRK